MPDPTRFDGALGDDLRAYFAATTATPLPRRVTQMSVGTLTGRAGRQLRAALAGTVGLAVAAALVLVVATHLGSREAAESTSLSAGSGAASVQAPAATSSGSAAIVYPGVDVSRLARGGAVLLAPAGHGRALLDPAQAQRAAVAGLGAHAGPAGPAVLTFAELTTGSQRATCLCWVVDVPVSGGVGPGQTSVGTALVLIDADNGRLVATLRGDGIP